MRVQQLLEHHGIAVNPFAEEDAQSDPVFKERCRDTAYHPAWDKVYGEPSDPATSIVFGEKGSGKTAMRMQIAGRIAQHNAQAESIEGGKAEGGGGKASQPTPPSAFPPPPSSKLFLIEYDNFNPFLDHFADRFSARRQRDTEKLLTEWKLWDHMDAILSLGVTSLVDRLLGVPHPTGSPANQINPDRLSDLDRQQQRDLLLLVACYDNSSVETITSRWHRLRRMMRFRIWRSYWDRALGVLVTLAVVAAMIYAIVYHNQWRFLAMPWPYVAIAIGWLPTLLRIIKWHLVARRMAKNVRVLKPIVTPLRRLLMHFPKNLIQRQPLPVSPRTDDRYELLAKFQGVLKTLGSGGIVVLVDRVDEPHLITGSAERMRNLVWSMLDNKFLKQPGVGLKLLLPRELAAFLERESRDFYQRARLDKQNMIPSLEWTGEALYDLANARLRSCGIPGREPTLRLLMDDSISDQRLVEAFGTLRVPRHLFKFLYRLLVAHCNTHTDDNPSWQIPRETFEATLAVYRRDQDAVDRGVQAG